MFNTEATFGDDSFPINTPFFFPIFHAEGNASSCPLLSILKLDKGMQ